MPIPLIDLKGKTGPNPGGIVDAYIVESSEVVSMADAAGIVAAIVLKEGSSWKKIEFAPGTCKLSQPAVGEDGSGSFDTLVDMVVDGDDDPRFHILNQMINGRYILVLDPASKNKKVVGTLRAPLLLRALGYDGGADNPERNGFTFQFKGRQGHLVYGFTGEIPSV
jgi:hypothetical protein